MKNTFFLILVTLFILTSCQENKESLQKLPNYLEESHSYAQPNDAVITHLDLDINVDFETQVISGTATYDIVNYGSEQIILDSKFLEIESVTQNGEQTDFELGDFDESLGQPLTVAIKEYTKKLPSPTLLRQKQKPYNGLLLNKQQIKQILFYSLKDKRF